MDRQDTRSPLGRAIGLGSTKEGAGQWWAERVSAVALVPLILWFAAAIIAHFHHTALGLQVVIEDYMHPGARFAALMAVRLGCFALAAAGIVDTLRIAFSNG